MKKEKNKVSERLVIDENNYSEIMFSLTRYYTILDLCKNKTVLDLACGTGYGSYIMSSVAKKVYGFDIAKEVIKKNKNKYICENLEFGVCSANSIPCKNNSFDIIVSCETIEHLNSEVADGFLAETKRLLKRNGYLFITTPNHNKTKTFESINPYHINEYTMENFEAKLKEYYKNVEIYFLDLNVVTYIKKANTMSKKLKNINIEEWKQTEEQNNTTLYMAALCSNASLRKKDMSAVLIDNKKTLNEKLWNKDF